MDLIIIAWEGWGCTAGFLVTAKLGFNENLYIETAQLGWLPDIFNKLFVNIRL